MTHLLRTTSTAALLLAVTGLNTPAFSQSMPVTVDLSVLNDGGYSAPAIPGYTGSAVELLMPGAETPRSSYFGPSVSVSNPILSAPSAPVVAEVETQADDASSMEPQPTPPASLSAADTVPPPPPEPVDVTVVAETAPTVATPEATEAPETPETQEMQAAAEPTTTAVALEPAIPAAPPAAPEAPAVPEAPETTEMSTSSGTGTTEVATTSSQTGDMAASGHALKIVFGEEDSKLPGDSQTKLSAIADQIKGSDDSRIQLLAYAGGENLSASKARRLSLSRALSVRSFFIENGVRSTRIDVRALGNKTDEQPINRVDINIVER